MYYFQGCHYRAVNSVCFAFQSKKVNNFIQLLNYFKQLKNKLLRVDFAHHVHTNRIHCVISSS